MKCNPVGWFEIYVQNMSRAKAFYEAVFQGQLTKLKNQATENLLAWRCVLSLPLSRATEHPVHWFL
jgi:hypothetical protein